MKINTSLLFIITLIFLSATHMSTSQIDSPSISVEIGDSELYQYEEIKVNVSGTVQNYFKFTGDKIDGTLGEVNVTTSSILKITVIDINTTDKYEPNGTTYWYSISNDNISRTLSSDNKGVTNWFSLGIAQITFPVFKDRESILAYLDEENKTWDENYGNGDWYELRYQVEGDLATQSFHELSQIYNDTRVTTFNWKTGWLEEFKYIQFKNRSLGFIEHISRVKSGVNTDFFTPESFIFSFIPIYVLIITRRKAN